MIELNKLAQEIHEAAVAKGFWAVDDAGEKHIVKMYSELAEAIQEDRCGNPMLYVDDFAIDFDGKITDTAQFEGRKPEGIAAELADFVMMALDLMASIGISAELDKLLGPVREAMRSEVYVLYNDTPLYRFVLLCIHALEKMNNPEDNADILTSMQVMTHGVELWLEQRGIDLWQVIRLKMEYNRARPPLHGRKY